MRILLWSQSIIIGQSLVPLRTVVILSPHSLSHLSHHSIRTISIFLVNSHTTFLHFTLIVYPHLPTLQSSYRVHQSSYSNNITISLVNSPHHFPLLFIISISSLSHIPSLLSTSSLYSIFVLFFTSSCPIFFSSLLYPTYR